MNRVIREAQRAALALKDEIRAAETLEYVLPMTSSRSTLVSQLSLYDPSLEAAPGAMHDADAPPIGLESVLNLCRSRKSIFAG